LRLEPLAYALCVLGFVCSAPMSETVFLENLGRFHFPAWCGFCPNSRFLGLAQMLCGLLENLFCLELLPVVNYLLARASAWARFLFLQKTLSKITERTKIPK
jgi:hypothetical protein